MTSLLTTLRDGALVPSLLARLTEPTVDRWPGLLFASLSGTLAARDRAGALTLTGSGAVRYKEHTGARINLVKNPRFATDTTGWTHNATAIARVTEAASPVGNEACRVSAPAVTNAGLITVDSPVGTTPWPYGTSKQVTISCYARLISGPTDWRLQVRNTNAAGGFVTSQLTNVTVTSVWSRVSATVTVTLATQRLGAGFLRGSPAAGEVEVTGFQIEEGAVATPYVDGSSPGAAWLDPITGILGNAHASPSVSRAAAWVEEGTTNTVPDPSFEAASITTSWTAQGAAAISKVTSHASLGSNSGKVACTASTADGIHQLATSGAAAANGQTWTVSGRVRAFAAGDVGKTVKPAIIERASDNAVVLTNLGSAITLTDAWQAFASTVVLSGGGTVAKVTMGMMNGAATVVDFVLDAVQLEQKAYATSPAIGDIGTGYTWAGAAHASASTRLTTTIKADEAKHIASSNGGIFCMFKRDSVVATALPTVFTVGQLAENFDRLLIYIIDSNDSIRFSYDINGVQRAAISPVVAAAETWYTVAVGWTLPGTISIAVNNEALVVNPTIPAPTGAIDTVSDLSLGSSSSQQLNGLVGPYLICDRHLTTMERQRLHQAGPGRIDWDTIRDAA